MERVADKHRSTTLKYLSELKQKELIEIRIKPETEKKYRPTYIYRLAPQVAHEDIVLAAQMKGIDIGKIVQERFGLGKQIIDRTPRSAAKTVDITERLQKSNPVAYGREEVPALMEGEVPNFSNNPTQQDTDNSQQQEKAMSGQVISDIEPHETLGSPENILSRLPVLPTTIPEYDDSWPDSVKADWMALCRYLVEHQNKND